MKIYSISLFLILYALTLSSLGSVGIFDSNFAAYDISQQDVEGIVPKSIAYSGSDLEKFSFGDFPRMLVTLGKVFAFAPAIASFSLMSLGAPATISTLVIVPLYIVYIVGLAQIFGRLVIRDAE